MRDLFGFEPQQKIERVILLNEPLPAKKTESQQRLEAPIFTSVLNIRPSYSVIYSERIDGKERPTTQKFEENKKNLAFNETGGMISKKAKKNIGTAIDWLLEAARPKKVVRSSNNSEFIFKINFVTLTLSAKQIHSDQEIKSKVLDYFIKTIRAKYNVQNYLWRAEAQLNGNIHFHLLTDRFIHYIELRDIWNLSQNRLGYVDRYEEKYGNRCPNSTDIHSVKEIKNISGYLSKYCCKNLCTVLVPNTDYSLKKKFKNSGLDFKNVFKKSCSDSKWMVHDITEDQLKFLNDNGLKVEIPRSIEGRLWFLSESLQKMKSLKIYLDDENAIKESFSKMYDTITSDQIKQFDFCTAIFWKISDYLNHAAGTFGKKISDFLQPLVQPPDNTVFYV